jgi:hypothetical protein
LEGDSPLRGLPRFKPPSPSAENRSCPNNMFFVKTPAKLSS